jgi:hypothetical protein
MKTALLKWTMVIAEVLLICVVAFNQAPAPSKRSSAEIAEAALQSDKNCQVGLVAEGKWPPVGYERGEYEIPPQYWTDVIKGLKPVKLYDHKLNVAIVLSIRESVEEGIYVFNVISSWGPIGENTDGFQFIRKPEERIVYFTRFHAGNEKSK